MPLDKAKWKSFQDGFRKRIGATDQEAEEEKKKKEEEERRKKSRASAALSRTPRASETLKGV